MKTLFLCVSAITLGFAQAQKNQEPKKLDNIEFNISVEPESPKVQMISTREKPEFPEVPIAKNFRNNILDRNRTAVYLTERKRVLPVLNVEEKIKSFK